MGKIKGIDALIKNIKKFGEEAEELVDDILLQSSEQIKANAKLNAPINNGKLKQSIDSERIQNEDHAFSIFVGGVAKDYAPYVEFGTGKQVSVPTELKAIADQYRGKGGGFEQGLQSIKDWCRNKGIEEKFAYPIFMSILKKGLTPQPFLYPAYLKAKKMLKKDLNDTLKDLTKKYNG